MPMTTKLDRLVIYVNDLLPVKSYDSLITWYFSISRDKLEQLYFHYHSVYDQTWEDGDLPRGPPTHKVI